MCLQTWHIPSIIYKILIKVDTVQWKESLCIRKYGLITLSNINLISSNTVWQINIKMEVPLRKTAFLSFEDGK